MRLRTRKISTLDELLLEELADLLNAENQLIKALPKMADATTSAELRAAIEEHLEVTKGQVNRLQEAFEYLGQKPNEMTCKAMKGIITEAEEVLKDTEENSAARDAAIIGAAQRVEHYEIAGYGTAASHASLLGHLRVKELLGETLVEEKEADEKLNQLAEGSINEQAMEGVSTQTDL